MPKPGGALAATLLTRYVSVEAPPIEAWIILQQIIIDQAWADETEAAVKARQWLQPFLRRATQLHNQAALSRTFITFTFSPVSSEHIQGSCFALPDENEQVKQDKKRRANALPMLDVVRGLTPREFEYLCGLVLKCLGVEQVNVSRSAGDEGVDFYGQASFGKLVARTTLPGAVEEPLRVWIVGQAKRYLSTSVSTSDLRELVGSVELSKAKVHASSRDPLENLKARLCDPIFYMMVTSGEFTSGSRQLIDRSGIIGMDGLQLCQFLADHGMGGGEAGFDRSALMAQINAVKQEIDAAEQGARDDDLSTPEVDFDAAGD